MRIRLAKFTVCLIGTVFAVAGRAAVIENVVSRADLIVVGSVETRVQTDNNVSFDIAVQRVIKGHNVSTLLHVNHTWLRTGLVLDSGVSQIDNRLDGIWFLKQHDGSQWDTLSVRGRDGLVTSLFLPATVPGSGSYQYASSASVTDKVVFELGAGLRSRNAQPEILVHTLGVLDSTAVNTVLKDFLQSSNNSFRAVALSCLLARSNQLALAKVSQLWPSISDLEMRRLVVSALRESFRDPSPSSAAQLADIADNAKASSDLRAAGHSRHEGCTYKGIFTFPRKSFVKFRSGRANECDYRPVVVC
jgi:hypothetical protein